MLAKFASFAAWTTGVILLLVVAVLILRFFIQRHRRRQRPQRRSDTQKPMRVASVSSSVALEATTSLAEVRRHHQNVSTKLKQAWAAHNEKERLATAHNFHSLRLEALMAHASREELANLKAILKSEAAHDSKVLAQALLAAGSSRIASVIRGGPVSYDIVLNDVAKKFDIEVPASPSNYSATEGLVIRAATKRMIDGMSEAQRVAYLREVAKNNGRGGKSVLLAGGGLALANLSGFALYTAASTSLAAVTGAVGITLPFAAYTGLSSALATITGPAGWAALGLIALYRIGKADLKKTVPAVFCVAAIRTRLLAEQEDMLRELSRARPLLETQQQRMRKLEDFLARLVHEEPSLQVPKSSVPY